MARIIVGTSGWHYASWRGPFFPDKLLARHQLRFYASQFEKRSADIAAFPIANTPEPPMPDDATARRWFEEVPEAVTTVRDPEGRLAGFSVCVTLADAPAWAPEDPALAPVFAHARDTGADPASTMVRRDAYDLTHGREGSAESPVLALINSAFTRQGDLQRVERQYCVNDE